MAFKEQESDLSKQLMSKQDGSELRRDLESVKAELIKWMFLFWIGQIAVLVAIIKLLK